MSCKPANRERRVVADFFGNTRASGSMVTHARTPLARWREGSYARFAHDWTAEMADDLFPLANTSAQLSAFVTYKGEISALSRARLR